MTPLLSAGDIMSQSWQFFTSHWKPLLKRASWFLLVFVLYVVFAVPASMKHAWGAYAIVLVLYVLGALVAVTHLTLYILRENGVNLTSPNLARRAVDLLAPLLWIVILTLVILSISSIVFLLPAIWLGVSLSFAYLFLLEDNIRGVAALKASYHLIKGRWWATLWRLLVPSIVIAIAIWAVSVVIWLVVGLVAGGSLFGIFAGLGNGANVGANIAGGFVGIFILFLAMLVGVIMQLATLFVAFCYPMIVRIKLFHSLKQSALLREVK